MSTAFLVDNILNDKEDRSDSIVSDTDSDATSDLKDSVCGSPESNENISPSHHYYHHHHHIHQQASGNTSAQLSETLLRTYNTMIRNSDCATSDDHSDDASNHFIEMCCTKCGHFQQLNKTRSSNNGTNGSGTKCIRKSKNTIHVFKSIKILFAKQPSIGICSLIEFSISFERKF